MSILRTKFSIIHLYGHTLSCSGPSYYGDVISVYSTFTLCDCSPDHSGKVIGTGGTNGLIHVYSGGIFNMYGGTITGNYSYYGGYELYVFSFASTMSGGYLGGTVNIFSSTMSVSGGYFSESAYDSISGRITTDCIDVNISESGGASFDSAYVEGFPYAVYRQGAFSVDDVTATYGTVYQSALNGAPENTSLAYSYENASVFGLPTEAGKYTVNAEIEMPFLVGDTYYAGACTFTVEILKKPLTVSVEVGYTKDDDGNIVGAQVNYLSFTGAVEGDDVTVTAVPALVKDSTESVVGVNVSFIIGGADADNYMAENKYIEIHNDLNGIIAELEKQTEALEEMIGTISDADLQTQINDINNLIDEAVSAHY